MIDIPAVFSSVVRNALGDLTLPTDSVVSAATPAVCEKATICLLKHLAQKGFKVSKTKFKYLGFVLYQGQRRLSDDRIKVIFDTKRALLAFLGLINYCRQWIPDCSFYDKRLRSAISLTDPLQQPLTWTADMIKAYKEPKQALCSAPALGLPDYKKPFHLYACKHQGTASAVLAQEHREHGGWGGNESMSISL